MKNTRFFAVILSAVILASCGTSHDVVDGGIFQKRKYNKGYHVSKKTNVKTTSEENDSDVASNVTIEKVDVKSEPISMEPISNNNVIIVESNEINSTDSEIASVDVQKEEKTVKSTSNTGGIFFKNNKTTKRKGLNVINYSTPLSMNKSDNTSDKQKTTDNTLLLVIIAFFIPFLAVGLYDGISMRFWISLILTLLFWLPGFIYALIVILE